jgi:heme/copper-type cytochrome/quinol oxidase subunit 2
MEMQYLVAHKKLIGVAILALSAFAMAPLASAEDATVVKLTLKNHKFQPAETHVPANKPVTIELNNQDTTPAEFESKTLRVEKIVAGGATATIQVRALAAGRYRFFDDYHQDTTEGVLIVE